MKKLILLALVGLFTTTINQLSAAFPVKTKTEKSTIKTIEKGGKLKATITSEVVNNEEASPAAVPAAGGGDKSQLAAGILCWLLGMFGVHDFYLGNSTKAFMKLGLTVLGLALMIIGAIAFVNSGGSVPILYLIGAGALFAAWIWTLIDLVRIIIGNYPGLD